MVDSVRAVIAIGASWSDCSLLEAVTTTSSIPPEDPTELSDSYAATLTGRDSACEARLELSDCLATAAASTGASAFTNAIKKAKLNIKNFFMTSPDVNLINFNKNTQ